MAISVLGRSAVVPGMRQIGISEYFPPLPKVDLLLYRAPGMATPAASALHEYLAHNLALPGAAPAGRDAVVDGALDAAGSNRGEVGPAIVPGPGGLEFGGDAQDALLLEPRRHQLQADRQPVVVEAAR
jgi:hypothetical protein